jgi:protein arginine N-methyltransferase 1
VGYFECAFSQIHKPIVFSTSPQSKYTHWKQTVFYLKDALTACAGEELSGVIACAPNSRNPRDLDIQISYQFAGRSNEPVSTVQEYRLR